MKFTDRVIQFIKETPSSLEDTCRYFKSNKNSTTDIIRSILDKYTQKGLLYKRDDVYYYNHELVEKIKEERRKKRIEKEEKQKDIRLNEVLHCISAGKMDIKLTEEGLKYVRENYEHDSQSLSRNVLKRRLCER